jgi:hypothetical protein
MDLYHQTSRAAAESIIASGFRNGTGYYLTARKHSGVWLTDDLDPFQGTMGDTTLRVSLDVDDTALTRFEWIEEGKGYREWLIPAKWLKRHSTEIHLMTDEELDEAAEEALRRGQ